MRKVITFLTMALFVTVTFAQQPEGLIAKTRVAPVIDGVLDEIWETAHVYNIDKPFRTEVPSIGAPGESTWRMLWDDNGVYVFVTVKDNHWLPSYAVSGNRWEYDSPEIYFDVNYVLVDGLGAMSGRSTGHYQFAPTPVQARINGTPFTDSDNSIWAFKVNDPDYTLEMFIPYATLKDKDGNIVDRGEKIGFDVTVIDRDPGDAARKRAVWANIGTPPGNESWNTMDEIGLVTFEGFGGTVYVDELKIKGGRFVTEDNGTLQLSLEVVPEDATLKTAKWSIKEGSTGIARISNDGLLTAVADGMVTVVADAADNGGAFDEITIKISGQVATVWEMNLIRNGLFDEVIGGGGRFWSGWTDASPSHTVVDGVSVHTPVASGDTWRYQFSQNNLQAKKDIPYTFQFVAWASEGRSFNVDFEDTAGNNYNRYGRTNDSRSGNGRSDWTFPVTTEPATYKFDVIFDQIIATTDQKVQFMLGGLASPTTVYIDNVLLVADADLAVAATTPTAVLSVKMGYWASLGKFNPATDFVDVAGNFNDWSGGEAYRLTPVGDPDHTYTIKLDKLVDGTKLEFKFRINGSWNNDKHEFPNGGPNRELTITGLANSLNKWFNDEVLSVRDVISNNLGVYPNPARDYVNVVSENQIRELRVINAMGQVVHAQRVGSDRAQIAVGGFDRGIYFIQVMTEKGVAVERVIINR